MATIEKKDSWEKSLAQEWNKSVSRVGRRRIRVGIDSSAHGERCRRTAICATASGEGNDPGFDDGVTENRSSWNRAV